MTLFCNLFMEQPLYLCSCAKLCCNVHKTGAPVLELTVA